MGRKAAEGRYWPRRIAANNSVLYLAARIRREPAELLLLLRGEFPTRLGRMDGSADRVPMPVVAANVRAKVIGIMLRHESAGG